MVTSFNRYKISLEPAKHISDKVVKFLHQTEEGREHPGGGLDKPIDRDQRSWVFLNDQKRYFASNRKPRKILFEKQHPKNTLKTLFISQKI